MDFPLNAQDREIVRLALAAFPSLCYERVRFYSAPNAEAHPLNDEAEADAAAVVAKWAQRRDRAEQLLAELREADGVPPKALRPRVPADMPRLAAALGNADEALAAARRHLANRRAEAEAKRERQAKRREAEGDGNVAPTGAEVRDALREHLVKHRADKDAA